MRYLRPGISYLLVALCTMVVTTACGGKVSQDDYDAAIAERDRYMALAEQQSAEIEAMKADYDELIRVFATEIAARDLVIDHSVTGIKVQIPSDVMFGSGAAAATVGAGSRDEIMKLVGFLKKNPELQVGVIGHTDSQAPSAALAKMYPTNWELGAARAASAVKFLQSQGIDPKRLVAISAADTDPIASNSTAEGRARNRRLELVLATNRF